ncbi:MAG: META domain-containing protein [Solirubrobacterales bacterium]
MAIAAGPASAASTPATFEMLDGTNWKSVKVKGNGKKPKKVELYFTEGQSLGSDSDEIVPILGTYSGCNWMGASYRILDGRVKWTSPAYGTQMGCLDDRDGWISKRLRLGMKIAFEGKRLVLKRGQAVVRLKPAPPRT